MVPSRRNSPRSPSISLIPSRAERTTLERIYLQSYGKNVGDVQTLFPPHASHGSTPQGPAGIPGHSPAAAHHPMDPAPQVREDIARALRASIPGDVSGTGLPAEAIIPRMLAAAVEAVAVRRVAAADRYPLHRAYPSPRGLFAADLELTGISNSNIRYRLDPMLRRLQPLPPVEGAVLPNHHEMRVTTHPQRFPEPYGTLRRSLSLLEAGHLLATVALTMNQAGLPCTAVFGSLAPSAERPAPGTCTAEEPEIAGYLFTGQVEPGPEHRILMAAAPATSGLIGLTAPDAERDSSLPPGPAPACLGAWLDSRSSGSQLQNVISEPVAAPLAASLNNVLAAALAGVASHCPDGAIRIFQISSSAKDGSARTMMEVGKAGSGPRALGPEASAPLSDLGFVFTVDFPAWLNEYGADADTVLHTLLGWLCQWACLRAAATGLFARPARNFDEAGWAAALKLPLSHTPAYQVWIQPRTVADDRRDIWSPQGCVL